MKPEKPKVVFSETQNDPIPSASDLRAKLGWAKIKSVARFSCISHMPMGPRNSIAVPHATDLIRSEIMELMAK